MAEQQPQVNMIMNPNDQMLRYMELNNDFMQGLARQLDTNDIVSTIHTFSGNSARSFRDWMRGLDRIYVDHEGDHAFMRRLVTRTVQDLAADFYADLKQDAEAPLTWAQTREAFYERFSDYVDAQIAQQKLKKIKQERKQGLHSFAQKVLELAREAYTPDELNNPIVVRELKNIFIDGLRDHRTAQHLIKNDVADLQAALQLAVRDELLQRTYRLRQLGTHESDRRNIEDMDIDCIEQDKTDDSDDPVTQKQWTEMAASVAAIATAVKNSSNSNQQGNVSNRQKYNYNRNSYQNSSNNSPVNSTHPVNRGPNTYSNNNRYENQRQNFVRHNPGYNYRPTNRNQTMPQQNSNPTNRPPLKWASNGDPICLHCGRQGHYKRDCWTLYPEMRPNNSKLTGPQRAEN